MILLMYKNDSTFRTLFRGFALKINEGASPLKNALAYFSLNSAKTRLYFYYRVKNGAAITDTLVTEFGFYSFNSANINTVRRTNSNNYLAYLNNGNPDDNLVLIITWFLCYLEDSGFERIVKQNHS